MSRMEENNDWATETLKEAPFWRDGMTPEEYDEEREYLGKNYILLQKGTYVPFWKQKGDKCEANRRK